VGCESTFPWKQKTQHEGICDFAPHISCSFCFEQMLPKHMEHHLETICTMNLICCKLICCGQLVPRSQMAEHMMDLTGKHMLLLEKHYCSAIAQLQTTSTMNQITLRNFQDEMKVLSQDNRNYKQTIAEQQHRIEWLEELTKPKVLHTLQSHSSAINAMVISESENRMYSGSYDTAIKVWDIRTFKCIETLKAEQDEEESSVWSLAISPKRKRLYSGDSKGIIHIWVTEHVKLSENEKFEGQHDGIVRCLILDDDTHNQRLYSSGDDGNINIWDLQLYTCLKGLVPM
jgi:WD40 repeat protein